MATSQETKFDHLKQFIKQLDQDQLNQLRKEIDKELAKQFKNQSNLRQFLHSGPVLSDEEIEAIQTARKELSQWRKN